GSTTGVTTDFDGRFSLTVPQEATQFVVSFIGFKRQVVDIGSSTSFTIVLESELSTLDEVVVVGYGTTTRRNLTGAVSSVSGTELQRMPVTSAAQALTGKVAGVTVTTTEGSPDADIKIRIRGGGSITQDNAPLYIVDGFPVASIANISPTEIESIDILKDASSTAIYGARGANGVVIITTKEGTEGKTTINVNAFHGVRQVTNLLSALNNSEFVMLQAEIQGATSSAFTSRYGQYQDIDLYDYKANPKWAEQLFGQIAKTTNYNANISGGTKDTRYNFGFARDEDEGVMLNSGYERTNINFRFNTRLNKRMTFDFNTRTSFTKVIGPGAGSAGQSSNSRLRNAISYRPVAGLAEMTEDFDPTDEEWLRIARDPVRSTLEEYNIQNRASANLNGAFNWKILDNLTYRLEGGYGTENRRQDQVFGPYTSRAVQEGGALPIGQIDHSQNQSYRIANTLNWNAKDVLPKNHSFDVLVGQEVNSDWTKSTRMISKGFDVAATPIYVLANMRLGAPDNSTSSESPRRNMLSYFGRLNYGLNDRYLATFTFRADGSSKFAEGNQWGYFPSAAVAWRFTEESFVKDLGWDWFYSGKLRTSLGMAGNNRINDDLWRLTYGTATGGQDYYLEGIQQGALVPGNTMANPNLKWETTITRNIGLDLMFWEGRMDFIMDLYWNTTRDLLITNTIPSHLGYRNQQQNIGQTSNKGVEFTLSGVIWEKRVMNSPFQVRGSFNIGFNKSNVDKLGEVDELHFQSEWAGSQISYDYVARVGQPLGLMWGHIYDGWYTFDDFEDFYAAGNRWVLKDGVPNSSAVSGGFANPEPGEMKLKKLDGEGGNVDLNGDKTIIGNANPKHTGGFNLMVSWKGFDLSAFFNWSYGNDIYNANRVAMTVGNVDSRRNYNILEEMNSSRRWMFIDPETGANIRNNPERLAEVNANAQVHSARAGRTRLTSWAIEDGSFLRLSTLTLGYSLPKPLIRKIAMENLRFYATGYNVALWTNYSGMDPEVSTRSAPTTPGLDWSAYPRARTIVFGVNITF
ncbi:MAG: TonB-dependent receptor, partial [Bacteroidales bacterium]|nr:TonB-dependent receptor [Bacteroidales bacterium]